MRRSLCAFALSCISLTASAGTLSFSTFLGGSEYDTAAAVATDLPGTAIVVGDPYSVNLLGQSRGSSPVDTYVVKLDAKGAVVFVKFLGGSGSELVKAVTTDRSGNIYVTGITDSMNFPVKNAFRSTL